MGKIISYDFGHMEGGEDTSANGILYEYSVVRNYGTVVVRELQKAGYTLVNCTPPNGNMSLGQSLSYRVSKANSSGSILHLCFHANCFNKNACGCEMEVASDSSARIGQFIQNEVVSLGFSNRGIKRPNLYVTRHTKMPCVLTEPFFIDNRSDCNKYNAEKLGCAIATGVLKALGNSYKPSSSNTSTYSKPTAIVTASALNVRESKSTSAKILGVLQNGKSVEVFRIEGDWVHIYYPPHGGFIAKQYVKLYNIPNSMIQKPVVASQPKNLYRIRKSWTDTKSQVGAYSSLDNAIDECKKHNGFNVYDEKGNVVFPKAKSTEVKVENKTPIMGKSILTKQQMKQYLLKQNDKPQINTSVDELVELFLQEGKLEDVRGDIAFCQAIKETGYFKFGGDMIPSQNNFCGLGTTGDGVKGAIFKTPQDGIKAQIQHLKAYASKEDLKSECIDPRFNLIDRGIAPNWEDLNGRWATKDNYGQEIMEIYNKIKLEEIKNKEISIILYYGYIDEYGANLLRDKMKLPVMSLDDFKANIDLQNSVDKVYMIGGQEKPMRNTILISGSGKIETSQAVIDYIRKM